METWRKGFIGVAAVIATGCVVLIAGDPRAVGNWLTLIAMLCLIVAHVLPHRHGD